MDKLREMLIRHEGRVLHPYKCPAGKNTIGVGWNFDANPLPVDIAAYLAEHGQITDAMCDKLLDISIKQAQHNCRLLLPAFDTYSENRRNALTDFVFNVGLGTAQKFKTSMAFIRARAWDRAADSMENSLWYKQVGSRSAEVVKMIREG